MSAVLGIVRQILLNAQFGLGPEAAAYYAAFRLPETVTTLIAGGTLTNALIPVLLRVTARDGEPAAYRLVNATLTALLALFAPLCAGAALAAPLFVGLVLAPGFDPTTQALTVALTRIMLLEVLLVVTEATLVAVLVSRNQLVLPALAIALRNVTLISGIVLAMTVPAVGIYGPTLGAVLDALLQLGLLALGLRRRGYAPRLVWAPADRELRSVGRLLGPNALAGLFNYGGTIVDTAFASLVSPALVGALLNAWLLVGLPIRLLGIAIGQGVLPRLAALSLTNEMAAFRRTLRQALLVSGGLSVIAAVALIGLGRPLIGLLFERGAFDAAAADLTYTILAVYALGLPVYVATEVASRALVARYDTQTAMFTNLGQLAVRAVLLPLLIGPLGAAAVPTTFVVSSALETAVLLAVLRLKTR